MAEFDLIIKDGTVVDGTRTPRYRADVGIRDGKIAQIGGLKASAAKRVLDAGGCVVAPGFVDLHTHYDAQLFWDPYCSISSWHGVTSVAIGNCGFGFAPCRPEDRDRAMLMMTRNEQIPMESMQAGMPWDWVSYPEFLDSVDRTPKGVNIISYFPLNPALIWVMGLDAAKNRSATPEERRQLASLFREALDAGGAGFTVQRMGPMTVQPDYDGTPMPTDLMTDEDVLLFAEVLRERDEGAIQITQFTDLSDPRGGTKSVSGASPGSGAEFPFLERLAAVSGRPIMYNNVLVHDSNPHLHRRQLAWLNDCNKKGLRLFGQALSVRMPATFKLDTFNLLDVFPAWNELCTGSEEEKLAKLKDPARRPALKAQGDMLGGDVLPIIGGTIAELTVHGCGTNPDLQRYVGQRVGDIAEAEGKHPVDVMLDLSIAGGRKVEFMTGGSLACGSNPDFHGEVLNNPYTVPGASDGGAHVKFMTGGSFTTDFLTWMVRETELVTLEDAHYKLSYLPAHAAGIHDRGQLREGLPADVVVYDLEALKRVPEWGYDVAFDFPAGEWRRVQGAEGYRWTIVNGDVTFEDGKCMDTTPGRLLRRGRG